jgi:hypothetical protein
MTNHAAFRLFTLWAHLSLLAVVPTAWAQPDSEPAPAVLLKQIEHLSELLRDPYASWYQEATMIQQVAVPGGSPLALAVFTVEGFGGGNNHSQYFAVFSPEEGMDGTVHYTLLDVLPIAGKGWRGVWELNARVSRAHDAYATDIHLDALAVGEDDAPNFPSVPVTLHLRLKDGRLDDLTSQR